MERSQLIHSCKELIPVISQILGSSWNFAKNIKSTVKWQYFCSIWPFINFSFLARYTYVTLHQVSFQILLSNKKVITVLAYILFLLRNLELKKSVLHSLINLLALTPPFPSEYNSGNAITSWFSSLIQFVGTWPWP